MLVSMIYARSENYIIGRGGGLPWRLPEDMKHFKRTTMGHPVIVGRRTFEQDSSLLTGRTNIILTRQDDYEVERAVVRHSLDEALQPYRDTDQEVFIIGGAEVYREAFSQAGRVYETVVHSEVEGDTAIPRFDFSDWRTTVLAEHDQPPPGHSHAFTIYRHDRER